MEKIWEQSEYESSKAFEVFRFNRDMGARRSISNVAKHLGKNDSLISRWSKTYEWVRRVNEYDSYMDKIRLEEREKQTKQFEGMKLNFAMLMTLKGGQKIESTDPSKIKISDAIRMVNFGVKLEREISDHQLEMLEKEIDKINNPPHEIVVRVVNAEDIRKEKCLLKE